MNLLRVQVRGSFEEFRGVSVFGFFRKTSFFRRPKIGFRGTNWLHKAQNWLPVCPKLASEAKMVTEAQNWLEKASEAQIGFRRHKIGFRRPKLASDGFRKKEAQIGFRRKPKIGFRRQKLASGPNWLWKAQNWLQKDQNSKLTSEGLLKLGFRISFRRPKMASAGQNWLQQAKICLRRPKLVPRRKLAREGPKLASEGSKFG